MGKWAKSLDDVAGIDDGERKGEWGEGFDYLEAVDKAQQ